MKDKDYKASMSFELKDGTTIHIAEEDVKAISDKIIVEMLINHQKKFMDSVLIQKGRQLYDILEKEKDNMTNTMKKDYLKAILEFMK